MKKKNNWLLFSLVLFFYALLYVATQKKEEPCLDDCQKIEEVTRLLRENRPHVYGTYRCFPTVLCVYVNDSLQRDWNALADTACGYMRNASLHNNTVAIIGNAQRDTLVKQACP